MELKKSIPTENLLDFVQLIDGRPTLVDFSFINPESFQDILNPEDKVFQIGDNSAAKDLFKYPATYKGTVDIGGHIWLAFEVDPEGIIVRNPFAPKPKACLLYQVIEPTLNKKALIVPTPLQDDYRFYKLYFVKGIIN